MYVTDGNYRQDTILKIPLLMFTCAKAAYLAGGVLLLTASAMFGWENIRLHEKCFLAGSVSCAFLVPMIGALVNDWPLDRPRTTRAITSTSASTPFRAILHCIINAAVLAWAGLRRGTLLGALSKTTGLNRVARQV